MIDFLATNWHFVTLTVFFSLLATSLTVFEDGSGTSGSAFSFGLIAMIILAIVAPIYAGIFAMPPSILLVGAMVKRCVGGRARDQYVQDLEYWHEQHKWWLAALVAENEQNGDVSQTIIEIRAHLSGGQNQTQKAAS